MKKIIFQNKELNLVPKSEEKLYDALNKISKILNINAPDLAFAPIRREIYLPELEGLSVTKDEDPDLSNNLVILNYELIKKGPTPDLILIGTLAHELRHLWQKTSNKYVEHDSSLCDPNELDADAFASYIVSKLYDINVEEAARIYNYDLTLYPYSIEGAFLNSLNLDARIELAKKLKEDYI